MATEITINLAQTEKNNLSSIAEVERAKLIPKNDYNEVGNPYSAVNKDAIADGDDKGKGTGVFLDVYNGGAGDVTDVLERKNEIKINKFNDSKPYPNF